MTRGEEENGRSSLLTMRIIAAALLVAMSILYVISVANREHTPVWDYVRAFSEAAMVGGLADWFAVTAIFRRPLGLPIPHTAVIPRGKDRIADALGDFVAVNFLAPDVVRDRLEDQNLAGGLADQIADEETARRIAQGIYDAMPAIADLLDDQAVSDFMRRQLGAFARDARLSQAIGRAIKLLTDQGRHQPVLDAALAEGWRALEEHEPEIRAQVRARTSWAWRLISLDARASDAMIGAMEDSLHAMARDPDHPGRKRITEALNTFANDLQNSPDLRAQIERTVLDMLAHPSVETYLQTLWASVKTAARRRADSQDQDVHAALALAVMRFGAALQADGEAQAAFNRRLRLLLTDLSGRHGADISSLISETIRAWDTRTVVGKLEQSVGPDLQYIRINGTLIGGLIGLTIHQATVMFAPHGGG